MFGRMPRLDCRIKLKNDSSRGLFYQTIGQIALKQAENTLFPDRMPTESTPNCGLSNAKPNQIWLNWGKSSAKINESPKMNPR